MLPCRGATTHGVKNGEGEELETKGGWGWGSMGWGLFGFGEWLWLGFGEDEALGSWYEKKNGGRCKRERMKKVDGEWKNYHPW